MEADIIINKVIITAEAKFDYEETLALKPFPKTAIKNEIEQYIDIKQDNGKLLTDYYFRAKYYDDSSDTMLMLFLYKAKRFRQMQTWELAGICLAEDWTEEIENFGQIRSWISTKIDIMLETKNDWVLELRAEKINNEKNMRCYSLIGLPREVKNAIFSGTDNEVFEKLSHIQRKGGK